MGHVHSLPWNKYNERRSSIESQERYPSGDRHSQDNPSFITIKFGHADCVARRKTKRLFEHDAFDGRTVGAIRDGTTPDVQSHRNATSTDRLHGPRERVRRQMPMLPKAVC